MLTDTGVKSEVRHATADTVLNDGASGKGGGSLRLKIRVGQRGKTATWFAWWQQDGRPTTRTLGTYPALSLADARARAADTVSNAKSPTPRLVAPSERTLDLLFAGYIAAMRKDGKSSADEVAGRLDWAKERLGADRLAGAITDHEIADLLSGIDVRGKRAMADHMRSYLSAAFNWGIHAATDYRVPKDKRIDWGIPFNPVAKIKRDTGAATARERNLSAVELRELWTGLQGEGFSPDMAACIQLLVLLGQRVRETLRMDGAEIDLEQMLWTIPRLKTKGRKRPHHVPLPKMSEPILRGLIARNGMGPLFPPATSGRGERMQSHSVNQSLRRWLDERKASRYQSRDIRRTWKSRMGDGAMVDRFTRDLIQQHAQGDTGGKHYDQADYLPQMRTAMMRWESWLENVLDDDGAKVARLVARI